MTSIDGPAPVTVVNDAVSPLAALRAVLKARVNDWLVTGLGAGSPAADERSAARVLPRLKTRDKRVLARCTGCPEAFDVPRYGDMPADWRCPCGARVQPYAFLMPRPAA